MAAVAPQPSFLATRRGKLTLALLAAVAFLDFVDASIVNIALPSIRRDLHFSEQALQWIPSGYLLTYGGFMLLGGRAADLLGRRRVLVTGTVVIGLSSLLGGFAGSEAVLVGARLAQGLGAAMTLPAALSILTTTFKEGKDRNTALGVWGGVGGLASAVGVLLGGLLTEGPGWRWAMFFFVTLYMQNVLGYSPIQAGAAYLPLTFGVGIAAGVSSQLLARIGTRPVIVGGALIGAGGVYWLSRIPVHGSYLGDLLPGMMVMSIGLGAVFVAVTTAANAGVPSDKAGLAAALLNASQQVGGALGLAIFSAVATSRTNDLLASHTPQAEALTSGFHRALLASSIFLAAAAVVGLRVTNTRGEE